MALPERCGKAARGQRTDERFWVADDMALVKDAVTERRGRAEGSGVAAKHVV